ncbi:Glycosyl transferase family 8 [seawater metagenome]|uniref:Glycosyl transferase family 8 n=1 Tax=seawater metagenome TaxID=1561972 RepID=A0A5E8CHD8_9ZZZZ
MNKILRIIKEFLKIFSFLNIFLSFIYNGLSILLSRKLVQRKLDSKDILLTTVCNDKYIDGLLILLLSIIKNNKNFDYKLKIYYQEDFSASNKMKVKKIYQNVEFEDVQEEFYKDVYKWFMCLCAFKEYEYKRVVFIDSDMICLGDINDIINANVNGIGFCPDINFNILNNFWITIPKLFDFNTGLMVIDKEYRTPEFYNKLLEYSKKQPDAHLGDQTILNRLLLGKWITYLPSRYNCKRNVFYNLNYNFYNNPKIIHFCGGNKPFLETKEKMYSTKICKNLIDEYFKYREEINKLIYGNS